ncbi:MAG: sigma factor-like helix-turn-helix DNA-binding protein [Pseudomonadota bacterium]
MLRRKGRRPQVPLDDLEESLFAHPGDVEVQQVDAETILNHLGQRQRSFVRLVSLEGRSCRQAGESLQMSEVAVRVALHRALKALAVIYRSDRS